MRYGWCFRTLGRPLQLGNIITRLIFVFEASSLWSLISLFHKLTSGKLEEGKFYEYLWVVLISFYDYLKTRKFFCNKGSLLLAIPMNGKIFFDICRWSFFRYLTNLHKRRAYLSFLVLHRNKWWRFDRHLFYYMSSITKLACLVKDTC